MIKKLISFILVASMCFPVSFDGYTAFAQSDNTNLTSNHTYATSSETCIFYPTIEPRFDYFEHAQEEAKMEPELEIEDVTEPIKENQVIYYDIDLDTDLQQRIFDICDEKGIDPTIVIAMAWVESRHTVDAIGDHGNSLGLMQIQPRWSLERMERLGVTNLLDPYQNVLVGIDILAEKLDKYDGNVSMALMAYNAGDSGAYNNWFADGVYTNQYSENVMAYATSLTSSINV